MHIQYMQTEVLKGKGEALAWPVWEGFAADETLIGLDKTTGGALLAQAARLGFKGKEGETLRLSPVPGLPYAELVLVGLGERKALTQEALWILGGQVTTALRAARAKAAALSLAFFPADAELSLLAALAQGLTLGEYRFDRYQAKRREEEAARDLKTLTLYGTGLNAAKVKAALARGAVLAEAIAHARDFANEPANILTPTELAARATALGKACGFAVKVEDTKQIAARKMGLFLAVAQGSVQPPKLIIMTYTPKGKAAKAKPVVLVGKGLTFDSGGLCIKDGNGMEHMKADMAGAAAVVAAMGAIAKLGAPEPVIAIVAACENMPDGNAYKVGDILTGANGKTVEMLNSDAEGRLTLADALVLAESYKPRAIVDLATLTGACVVALGEDTAGLLTPDDELADTLRGAFLRAGEDLWRLPLTPRLKRLIKSDVADMKNIGGRYGGALTAGLFLKEFVDHTPWAHLDIAGPSFLSGPTGPMPKAASGYGVAGLLEWLCPAS